MSVSVNQDGPNLARQYLTLATTDCGPDVPFKEGITALLRGLESRGETGFYIQTSGAALIWEAPDGDAEGTIWDDVRDIGRIRGFSDSKTHAATDRVVLEANSNFVNTAIVSPPLIVGLSPSPLHRTPLTFPDTIAVVKALKAGFIVGKGANRVCYAEVDHLAQLFILLVQDALNKLGVAAASVKTNPQSGSELVPTWGPEAYYFLSTAEMAFEEFMTKHLVPAIEKAAPDMLTSPTTTKAVSVDEILEIVKARLGGSLEAAVWSRHIAEGMATAMRIRGSRAEKVFGFNPAGPIDLDACVAEFLKKE